MDTTDFKHLAFLAETEWGLPHLKEFLYRPNLGLWRSSLPDLCSSFRGTFKRRFQNDEPLINFLDLHLITEALVNKDKSDQWPISFINEQMNVNRFFPEISWFTCVSGHWLAVPVFLVHEPVCLRYFIVGLVCASSEIALWPDWAERLMDESTKEGIISAKKACCNLHSVKDTRKLIVYPLTIDNQMTQFREASLALPIALGFMALLSGEPMSDELAATGSVRQDGAVARVSSLDGKITHARNKGFRIFLLPADNQRAFEDGAMTLVPIDDVQQAWMFAKLYTPGWAAELPLMKSMLNDPVSFISNCHRVPIKWLEWTRKNGMSCETGKLISKSPDLFDPFVERLGFCVENGDISRGESLAKLVDPVSVSRFMNGASLSLFKWYTLNLSMANHRGDFPTAVTWQKKALAMVNKASVRDAELFASFYNHRFICLHHNRYDFSPELPPFLQKILNALEAQYASQCEMVKNATNETLGALYGSIAQNYGFCGPKYLDKTRAYCNFARKVYGGGSSRRLKHHWRRPLNYLVYAELDAGCLDEAETSLLAYLEMAGWQNFNMHISGFSQWQHAALARFFEASGERAETAKFEKWALENKARLVESKHPWQLWLNNLGRISYGLGNEQDARVFFSESLALCLSERLGPTVHVMGLLPLSGLQRISAVAGLDVEAVEKRIRASAKNLNPGHFRSLLEEPDLTVVLDVLWGQPEVLFPFTYR